MRANRQAVIIPFAMGASTYTLTVACRGRTAVVRPVDIPHTTGSHNCVRMRHGRAHTSSQLTQAARVHSIVSHRPVASFTHVTAAMCVG